MAGASIPVDLFNPGQVFACLGFLEVADALLGDAEGGFDCHDEAKPRFALSVRSGDDNPFASILEFLAAAEVRISAHRGYEAVGRKKDRAGAGHPSNEDGDGDGEEAPPATTLDLLGTFPDSRSDPMALPVQLVDSQGERCRRLVVSHWADGSSRNDFKLYSGNRSAATIARTMLQGSRKPAADAGAIKTRGLVHLWNERRTELIANPFDALTPMGGSFNFDPRGAWTAIHAGYSPNDQKHGVEASPVVEILAAIGLEHARPDEFQTRQVRYGVWGGLLPPVLARPALSGLRVGLPIRVFQFTLDLAGKNKIVTFAQEDSHHE